MARETRFIPQGLAVTRATKNLKEETVAKPKDDARSPRFSIYS